MTDYITYLNDKIYYLLSSCNSNIKHVNLIFDNSKLDLKLYGDTCIVFLSYESMLHYRDLLIELLFIIHKEDKKNTKLMKSIYIINELNIEYNIKVKHNRLDFSNLIDKINTSSFIEDKVNESIESSCNSNYKFMGYVKYGANQIRKIVKRR